MLEPACAEPKVLINGSVHPRFKIYEVVQKSIYLFIYLFLFIYYLFIIYLFIYLLFIYLLYLFYLFIIYLFVSIVSVRDIHKGKNRIHIFLIIAVIVSYSLLRYYRCYSLLWYFSITVHIIPYSLLLFQMVFFSKNPCKWCKNSGHVTSKIIGLDLKNSKGEILNVSNLRKDIEIIVLREQKQYLLASQDFVIGSTKDSTQLHKFNASSVDMSASVEFVPGAHVNADWVIMVRHDQPPTNENYDMAWALRSTRRTKRDNSNNNNNNNNNNNKNKNNKNNSNNNNNNNNSNMGEKQEEASRIFFIPSQLFRPLVGVFYVGVSVHSAADVNYTGSRNNSNITYHLNILTSSCYFWDGKDEWRSDDCQVMSYKSSYLVIVVVVCKT